ncbi:hypothetical protein [Rubritalea tangerina]|uniref:Uncharacterized protein n=1 Tax=Rubritalea tangerina TaxID=430798 RepID=A0ABW4Z6M8_9BACT
MKRNYIQSICVFAIILPVLAATLCILVISFTGSSLLGSFKKEQQLYESESSQNLVLDKLLKGSQSKKATLDQWNKLLVGDSFTRVNKELREAINKHNSTKTLQLIEQNRAQRPNFPVDSGRSACNFVLEGTFKELQHCATELECTLPNLMVNQMSIRPQSSGNLLELELKYTIWENVQ